jgi:hypothetical protein
MRIALLGGYGNAGRMLAGLLRRHTSCDLLILGRDSRRAQATARGLGLLAGDGSVDWAAVDARRVRHLPALLESWDVLVVASSTVPETGALADAALEAGCDWLDLNTSVATKRDALKCRLPRILEKGCCFVTDGGVHPGVPGALVRHAAARMPLRRAWVAARFEVNWSTLRWSAATREEFLDDLAEAELRLLVNGLWVRGHRYARSFDFGDPLGSATCVPMFLPELLEVRDAFPKLEDLGFFVAGFGPVTDWIVMPLATFGAWALPMARRCWADLLGWGLATFGESGKGSAVILQAEGASGQRLAIRLYHPDAYALTAAPAAAALLRWQDTRRPGLHTQAGFVDPALFLDDLQVMEVTVATTE